MNLSAPIRQHECENHGREEADHDRSSDGRSWQGGVMTWASKLAGVSLVQEHLDEAKAFYTEVFELQAAFADEHNVVFKIGETTLHLLGVGAAPDLLGPGAIAAPSAGHRVQLAIQVDDVDDLCGLLRQRGVLILSGPMDRPWGIRTANFEDPGGHLWEVWTDLP